MAKRKRLLMWCCPNCYNEGDYPFCEACATDLADSDAFIWPTAEAAFPANSKPSWLVRLQEHKAREAQG